MGNNTLSFELPNLNLLKDNGIIHWSNIEGTRHWMHLHEPIMFNDTPIEYPKQIVLSFEELMCEE